VRLNCVDHYQATPSEFDPPLPYRDGAAGKYDRSKVPVIRIFGATETGQKVCVHVHGAFPYLYIEYDGPLDPEQGEFKTRCTTSLFLIRPQFAPPSGVSISP
jgi:DNA polymerase zeta